MEGAEKWNQNTGVRRRIADGRQRKSAQVLDQNFECTRAPTHGLLCDLIARAVALDERASQPSTEISANSPPADSTR